MKNQLRNSADELAHADRNLEEAAFSHTHGYVEVGVRMLYYSLFHYEKAIIASRSVYTKSHKQTHIEFRRLFVKEGLVPNEVSKLVNILQTARENADYGDSVGVTLESLAGYISAVRTFGERCREILAQAPSDTAPNLDS